MYTRHTRIRIILWVTLSLALSLFLSACSSPLVDSSRSTVQQFFERLQHPPASAPEEAGQAAPTEQPAGASTAHTTSQENEQIIIVEEIAIGLLLLAVVIGIVAHRLRVPYTVGLVLIGLALTLGVQLDLEISPNLILALLVPPLIFEAAFHLNLSDLKNNLAHILTLAVPGVILTTILVGLIVSWGTGLALSISLVFGALVSATDPVSVVALFRTMVVSSESLKSMSTTS